MITTKASDKIELLTAIDEAVFQLQELISVLDEKQINVVPYSDSWTAAQLFDHITKSTNAMGKAMRMEAKPATRNAGEKISELRKTFLDFTIKLKSPDFIVPEKGPFEKQVVVEDFNKSIELFKHNTIEANLNEIIRGLPFGEVTKLELLHFTLYHTQRHLNQMQKIVVALQNK